MKKIILPILLSLISLACGFIWPLHPSTPTAGALPTDLAPTPTATLLYLPPPPTSSMSMYQSQKYGFSFVYPDAFPLTIQSDEYIEVGDKIVVFVMTMNPAEVPGDRPLIETTSDVQPARYPAKLYTGYLGAIGGYIPQQIRMYVFEHNGVYIAFTLYALGLHVTEGDFSQIVPIYPEDEKIFDNIVKGLELQ